LACRREDFASAAEHRLEMYKHSITGLGIDLAASGYSSCIAFTSGGTTHSHSISGRAGEDLTTTTTETLLLDNIRVITEPSEKLDHFFNAHRKEMLNRPGGIIVASESKPGVFERVVNISLEHHYEIQARRVAQIRIANSVVNLIRDIMQPDGGKHGNGTLQLSALGREYAKTHTSWKRSPRNEFKQKYKAPNSRAALPLKTIRLAGVDIQEFSL